MVERPIGVGDTDREGTACHGVPPRQCLGRLGGGSPLLPALVGLQRENHDLGGQGYHEGEEGKPGERLDRSGSPADRTTTADTTSATSLTRIACM
jgi:hypothetical protein